MTAEIIAKHETLCERSAASQEVAVVILVREQRLGQGHAST